MYIVDKGFVKGKSVAFFFLYQNVLIEFTQILSFISDCQLFVIRSDNVLYVQFTN